MNKLNFYLFSLAQNFEDWALVFAYNDILASQNIGLKLGDINITTGKFCVAVFYKIKFLNSVTLIFCWRLLKYLSGLSNYINVMETLT